MNKTEKELDVRFRRSRIAGIKGERTRHVVTLNPNKINPNEELYVDIPLLKPDSCLVPGSLHLLSDFKNTNTKSLQKLTIKLAGETVYNCSGKSVYGVYKDLWKTNSERDQMLEYGIAGDNLRKLISKDDSGATSGNAGNLSDALVYSIYGSKQKVCLDRILHDHGLYAPFSMNNNFRYSISFPKSTDMMVAQSSETVGTYSLENLELEYETIENPELADQVPTLYGKGRSLSYEHVTLMKTLIWDKSTILVHENINLPRKSMKAVVLLFTNQTRTDSENYVYPNIESVKLTIEGDPNSVYSQGIPKSRFYGEARRLFGGKDEKDQFMTIQKFYKDKFALVIDLRSKKDLVTANGEKIVHTVTHLNGNL